MPHENANNKKNNRRYSTYMDEVRGYLGKVERGRAVRKVDPTQPALDESAEKFRQVRAVDAANAYERLMKTR